MKLNLARANLTRSADLYVLVNNDEWEGGGGGERGYLHPPPHMLVHVQAHSSIYTDYTPVIHFFRVIYKYIGILVPVRTSFGLRRRSGKTYIVST